ncbi:hypothetical protein JKP88DRAFT_280895 [Tribonema minus]|uniref:Uncharacterized protein n=1 Tax=Tribonema minus TaxID=303371 RepID=A0A836CBB6_9STRA|nr:hypothetical protein JKP88DRAFT_280895 [Tribonema minus]
MARRIAAEGGKGVPVETAEVGHLAGARRSTPRWRRSVSRNSGGDMVSAGGCGGANMAQRAPALITPARAALNDLSFDYLLQQQLVVQQVANASPEAPLGLHARLDGHTGGPQPEGGTSDSAGARC